MNRICLNCGSNTTAKSKEGWEGWYRYEDGWYASLVI